MPSLLVPLAHSLVQSFCSRCGKPSALTGLPSLVFHPSPSAVQSPWLSQVPPPHFPAALPYCLDPAYPSILSRCAFDPRTSAHLMRSYLPISTPLVPLLLSTLLAVAVAHVSFDPPSVRHAGTAAARPVQAAYCVYAIIPVDVYCGALHETVAVAQNHTQSESRKD